MNRRGFLKGLFAGLGVLAGMKAIAPVVAESEPVLKVEGPLDPLGRFYRYTNSNGVSYTGLKDAQCLWGVQPYAPSDFANSYTVTTNSGNEMITRHYAVTPNGPVEVEREVITPYGASRVFFKPFGTMAKPRD